VLFWGILGVILLRGIMIGLGAAIVSQFHWVLYIFAIFLMFTGVKMLWMLNQPEHEFDVEKNIILRLLKKYFNVTNQIHGNKFLVKLDNPKTGKKAMFLTPLLVALIVVEFADLIFAVDSVPAIFAITTDPYVIYTSNIFAILGLRALYFALDAIIHRFKYLKPALAIVLIFIGSKIFISDFLLDGGKFPIDISLGITFGLLGAGVIVSLIKTRKTA
jgi:tellurite resistance protein TerC